MRRRNPTALLLLLLVCLLCCTPKAEPTPIGEATAAPSLMASPSPVRTVIPTASPVPTPAPTPTPSATPEPTATPVPTPFSLIWLPDTQGIVSSDKAFRRAWMGQLGEEIAARIEPENVVCVLHTGDIVDYGNRTKQWETFGDCLNAFIDRIPFYPVSGNHDVCKYDSVTGGSYKGYLEQPFLKRLNPEQTFEGGKMLYAVLGGGEHPLLLLGIGYDMGREADELAWIDEVMRSHADMPCIVFTHAYITWRGTVLRYCRQIEENIVARYPNICMLLCGHARGNYYTVASYDDDGDGTAERKVHILLFNGQDEDGYLYRALEMDMIRHSVAVRTYALGSSDPVPDDPNTHQPADFLIENFY